MSRARSSDIYKLTDWLEEQGVLEDVQAWNPDGRKRWEFKLRGLPTVAFPSTKEALAYIRGVCDALRIKERR